MQYARSRVTRQQFMTLFVGGLTVTGGLAVVGYFALVWGGSYSLYLRLVALLMTAFLIFNDFICSCSLADL